MSSIFSAAKSVMSKVATAAMDTYVASRFFSLLTPRWLLQSMMTDQLFAACNSGNVNDVDRLLSTLTEINLNTIKWSFKFSRGLTLLTLAASKGHAKICQMLMEKGAEVNNDSGMCDMVDAIVSLFTVVNVILIRRRFF